MTELASWFQRHASLRWAIAAVLLVVGGLLAFFLVISPWLERQMGGQRVLDVSLYTAEGAQATLVAYGPQGREIFLTYLAVDLLTPVAYGPLLALATSFAAARLGWPPGPARVATLLPLAAWLFDWGENASLAVLTIGFPHFAALGWFASALTLAKFVAFVPSLLLAIAGLLAAVSAGLAEGPP